MNKVVSVIIISNNNNNYYNNNNNYVKLDFTEPKPETETDSNLIFIQVSDPKKGVNCPLMYREYLINVKKIIAVK